MFKGGNSYKSITKLKVRQLLHIISGLSHLCICTCDIYRKNSERKLLETKHHKIEECDIRKLKESIKNHYHRSKYPHQGMTLGHMSARDKI